MNALEKMNCTIHRYQNFEMVMSRTYNTGSIISQDLKDRHSMLLNLQQKMTGILQNKQPRLSLHLHGLHRLLHSRQHIHTNDHTPLQIYPSSVAIVNQVLKPLYILTQSFHRHIINPQSQSWRTPAPSKSPLT